MSTFWEALVSFVDALVYTLLSSSWILSLLASLLLVLRIRSIRRNRRWWEQHLYLVLMISGMAVWIWNGLRPVPEIFEDRVGLFWGVKTDNVQWHIYRPDDAAARMAFRGTASLAVQFGKPRGWLMFHHFPTAPSPARYEALEFFVRKNDLRRDTLVACLFGDNKVQYPSSEGIPVTDKFLCPAQAPDVEWMCVHLPLAEFNLPTGIIGIGIGKSDGVDAGTFYLDDVRLIEKR